MQTLRGLEPYQDRCFLLLQVLKGGLSVHQPTIMCGGFVYEEGDDLDEDELEANAANLPKMLQALPGTLISLLSQCQAGALQMAALLLSGQARYHLPLQLGHYSASDAAVLIWQH